MIYFKMIVKIKLTDPNAKLPIRSSYGAAGYDLTSCVNAICLPGDKIFINTGIVMEMPLNWYAKVAPRSGLALNQFIDVGGGVIDNDYRGEIGVILFNFGTKSLVISNGDKIAQLIFHKYETPVLLPVSQRLTPTGRGDKGFGSTE